MDNEGAWQLSKTYYIITLQGSHEILKKSLSSYRILSLCMMQLAV